MGESLDTYIIYITLGWYGCAVPHFYIARMAEPIALKLEKCKVSGQLALLLLAIFNPQPDRPLS